VATVNPRADLKALADLLEKLANVCLTTCSTSLALRFRKTIGREASQSQKRKDSAPLKCSHFRGAESCRTHGV
jgi:hypothetical protein